MWRARRHAHREQEELYLVLEGTAQIEAGGTVCKLGDRDTVAVPAGIAHQLSIIGLGPLTFVAWRPRWSPTTSSAT